MTNKRPLPGMLTLKVSSLIKSRAKACKSCRERKRKCDRERPSCSYCLKHGLSCMYECDQQKKHVAPLPKVTPPLEKSIQPQSNVKSSTKAFILAGPESILNKNDHDASNNKLGGATSFSTSSSAQSSGSLDDTTPPSSPSLSEKRIHKLASESSRLEGLATSAECENIDKIQSAAAGFFPFHQKATEKQEKLPEIESEVSPNDRKGTVFTNIINSSLFNSAVEPQEDLQLLLSAVPDKQLCDNLLLRYSVTVHPIIPILDMTQFRLQYEAFWNNHTAATLPFYMQLFTILYSASIVKYEEDALELKHEELRKRLPTLKKYVGSAEIAMSMYRFPRKITIEALESAVILHSVLRNDCRTNDSGSIGALIRLAQTIELNRDPLRYHDIKDENIVQRRRLLWWQLFYLDVTTSLSNRLNPIIAEDSYDTQYPSEYIKDLQNHFILNQPMAFLNGRFRWAECTNKILHHAFTLKPLTELGYRHLHDEIENLSFFTTSLIQRILNPNNILPSQEQFAKFSASVLSTLADRAYLLLYIGHTKQESQSIDDSVNFLAYRTYENVKIRPNTADSSSIGNVRIEKVNAHLIDSQIHLLSEFCKYGQMPQNKIFLWDIRKFQPIQSMLALLRSLLVEAKNIQSHNHKPFYKSYDFSNDRKVQMMDEAMIKLSYMAVHTTKLCKTRWNLLKNLKDATWIQLGIKIPGFASLTDGTEQNEQVSDRDWCKLLEDLDKLEDVVDENINMKVWDQKSGSYLS